MEEYIAHYFGVHLRTKEKQNLKNNLTQSCEYTCNLQIQLEILQSRKNNIIPVHMDRRNKTSQSDSNIKVHNIHNTE